MKIRKINTQDLPAIARFETEIAEISFGDQAITDSGFHLKKLAKSLTEAKDIMMVGEINGEVAGWFWICPKLNSVTEVKYAYLKSFYITVQFRGEDYSRQLMEAVLKCCKNMGTTKISSKVHYTNAAMRRVFERAGFIPVHLAVECSCG